MEDAGLKSFVNKIFKHEGIPAVKNFAKEFSDGGKQLIILNLILILPLALFVKLFNILYEAKVDCHLSKSILYEDKLLNWNRINA